MTFSREENDKKLSIEELAAESKSSSCRQAQQKQNYDLACVAAEKKNLLSKCKAVIFGNWIEKQSSHNNRSDITYEFIEGSFNRCLNKEEGKDCGKEAREAFIQCTNTVEKLCQDTASALKLPSYCKR